MPQPHTLRENGCEKSTLKLPLEMRSATALVALKNSLKQSRTVRIEASNLELLVVPASFLGTRPFKLSFSIFDDVGTTIVS